MRTKAKGDSFRACWGCDHWRRVGGAATCMACHYALDTGRCRSPICPPGEGCTVREEKGVRVPWSPAHKYQIPPKAYRAEAFEEFYNQGLNDVQIAQAVGCHQWTVASWRKRTGRPSNYKREKAATDPEKIKKDFESRIPDKDPCPGCRSKDICESYGGTCNEKARWNGENRKSVPAENGRHA